MKITGDILFKETQQFRVAWLWWLIIFCVLGSIGLTIALSNWKEQKTPTPWVMLFFVFLLEAGMLYVFYITKLETVVTAEGIFLKWWPFQRSYFFISAGNIKTMYLRKPPLNYGYHWTFSYGRTFNLSTSKGIQFVLSSGKKIFLGTQRTLALQEAVEEMIRHQRK